MYIRRLARRAGVAAAIGAGVTVLLAPGMALADATVTAAPATVLPGGSTTLTVDCGADAFSATLDGTPFGEPADVALTVDPDGGPGAFSMALKIKETTLPGRYALTATCDNGETGTAMLVVAPAGPVTAGGGSTSGGTDIMLVTAGAGLVAIAGIGVVVLRRRDGA